MAEEIKAEELQNYLERELAKRPEGCRRTLQEELKFYDERDPGYARKLRELLGISE
jgi:hypothetical protein